MLSTKHSREDGAWGGKVASPNKACRLRVDRHTSKDDTSINTGVDRRASRGQGKTARRERGSGVKKSNSKEAWRRQTIESQLKSLTSSN